MRQQENTLKKLLFDHRGKVKFLIDFSLWVSATLLAYLIRLDGNLSGFAEQAFWVTGIVALVKLPAIIFFRTYRQAWRNTSFADLFRVAAMVVMVSFLFFIVVAGFRSFLPASIPLSIPILDMILGGMMLGSVRASARFLLKYRIQSGGAPEEKKRVLIAGAGESGTNVAKEMLKHPKEGLLPVAFLDDNPLKQGQRINGIPVVGSIAQMPAAARKYKIDEILIAMPSETGDTIRKVVEVAQTTGVRHRIIPGLYDLVSGRVTINQIRNVNVEDLLRRKQVELDTEKIRRYVKGKNILVTGAGGSIGSEIVRQLTRFNPARLILLGRGENSIYELVCELREKENAPEFVTKICDVRDEESLAYIFESEHPDVIYHAAAHKHVPLMEQNPDQAVLNNVMGTKNLVELALLHKVTHFVNISTDKAVNPTSVMGATKRLAEQLVQSGAARVQNGEVFVSVRFGNVLGSRGSVIPLFKRQIRNGGPVTVTHPDMQRYFMTIPEASQLVLQAGALDQNGAVYLLDMGKPVNIEQMARDLIKLSGFEPDTEIEISYTGIRPGEKLYEELATDQEELSKTEHEKIFITRRNGVWPDLDQKLVTLFTAVDRRDRDQIVSELKKMIPGYGKKAPTVTSPEAV